MMTAAVTDRFETVAWVYNPSDLALLMSKFIEADIFVHRASEGHISANPGWTTALGGIELRVREEDAAAARALLAVLEPRPHRVRLDIGLLLVFLVMAFFAVGAPPRQIPSFVTAATALRPEG
jgi:hypothetical protein